MGMNVCYSGGAKGADLAWGLAAIEVGHDVVHYSFKGANPATQKNILILNEEELAAADEHLKIANKGLKRSVPFHKPWIANLLRRNWYQVKDTERVYAVSKINPMASSRSCVEGGTAWAVEMALDVGVNEIYVFDQSKDKWFYRKSGLWLEGMPPTPHGKWTGIGSRDLTEKGLQAIIDVFNQPKL